MRVKIELLKDDNDQNGSISIEQHHRRGDMFTINRADTVVGGESQTVSIPPGGRLVINTPHALEQPVYDRDQGASVYPSRQSQGHEGGDKPNPDDVVKAREADLARAKEAAAAAKEQQQRQQEAAETATRTPPQGGQPIGHATGAAPGYTPVNNAAKPTTVDASKAPNPTPGAQPSNPATAQAQKANTEKK